MIRTILHKYSGAWLSPIPLQPRTGSAIVVKTQGMRGKKDPLEQVAASAPQGSVCGTTSRFNISVVASVLDKGLFCSVKMLEVSDGTIRPSQAQGDRQDLAYTNTCSIPALKMLVGEERRGFIGPEDVAAATDCDGGGGDGGSGHFLASAHLRKRYGTVRCGDRMADRGDRHVHAGPRVSVAGRA